MSSGEMMRDGTLKVNRQVLESEAAVPPGTVMAMVLPRGQGTERVRRKLLGFIPVGSRGVDIDLDKIVFLTPRVQRP